MVSCDCCGREVDERSLQVVGKYFVCVGCYGGYDEGELIEKCEEVAGNRCEEFTRLSNIECFRKLTEQFKVDTGRDAVVDGVIDPGYTGWLLGLDGYKQ